MNHRCLSFLMTHSDGGERAEDDAEGKEGEDRQDATRTVSERARKARGSGRSSEEQTG